MESRLKGPKDNDRMILKLGMANPTTCSCVQTKYLAIHSNIHPHRANGLTLHPLLRKSRKIDLFLSQDGMTEQKWNLFPYKNSERVHKGKPGSSNSLTNLAWSIKSIKRKTLVI